MTVGALALVLVASGAATAPSASKAAGGQTCPSTDRSASDQGIRTTSHIVAAVGRGVPRIFRHYTTQGGGPGWHHFQVLGLLSVGAGPRREQVDTTRYWRQVVRRCGRAVAFNTWVAFLQFPEGPMASTSFGHMFVTRTSRGWVAWWGSIDPLH